ncbi:MAG: hypothetical protein II336_19755 [Loktanella sp.]|nr:hypothetical protein [Loktanella sp.]
MLDTAQNETQVVWGIVVSRQANGRFQWPAALKDKAVERILGGETIVSVAPKIGAKQSLVAQSARAFGDLIADPTMVCETTNENTSLGLVGTSQRRKLALSVFRDRNHSGTANTSSRPVLVKRHIVRKHL